MIAVNKISLLAIFILVQLVPSYLAIYTTNDWLTINKRIDGPKMTVDSIERYVEQSHEMLAKMEEEERKDLTSRMPLLENLYEIMKGRQCSEQMYNFRSDLQSEFQRDDKSVLWMFAHNHNSKFMEYCAMILSRDLAHINAKIQSSIPEVQVDQLREITRKISPYTDLTKESLAMKVMAKAIKQFTDTHGIDLNKPEGVSLSTHLAEIRPRLSNSLLGSCNKLTNLMSDFLVKYYALERMANLVMGSIMWPAESKAILERANLCQYVNQRAPDLYLFNNYDFQQARQKLYTQGEPTLSLEETAETVDLLAHLTRSRINAMDEDHHEALKTLELLQGLENADQRSCGQSHNPKVSQVTSSNQQYGNLMRYLEALVSRQLELCVGSFLTDIKSKDPTLIDSTMDAKQLTVLAKSLLLEQSATGTPEVASANEALSLALKETLLKRGVAAKKLTSLNPVSQQEPSPASEQPKNASWWSKKRFSIW